MSFENRGKTCMAQVISTIKSGMVWSMDWGFLEKTQLRMTISMERDVVNYSPKWMGAIYFLATICGSDLKRSRQSRDFCSTWSIVGNLKSKSVNSQGRDVIGGIQPMFVYQFASPNYYELMED